MQSGAHLSASGSIGSWLSEEDRPIGAPLQGIRVVELASFVAAPSAGALLHDLGADVVKVEVPWGEVYRHSTAKMMGLDSDFGLAGPFQMSNHGKRSLALDLALPQAQALALGTSPHHRCPCMNQ